MSRQRERVWKANGAGTDPGIAVPEARCTVLG